MRVLLQTLSLSDRYERKAQLLPGAIAASPLTLTIATTGAFLMPWYGTVGATVGVELVLTFLLGYLARILGRAVEAGLWRDWGGPPTTRWLRPSDSTCSDQQKSRWRGVLQRITGLKIPATVTAERTEAEIDRVTADAVRHTRNVLRNLPVAGMVQIHNEEYGFARNLLGLRWYWVAVACLSVAFCVLLLLFGEPVYLGLAVSIMSLLLALLVGRQLHDQVKRCAERYAESLFTAAVMFDQGETNSHADPPTAPAGVTD
jgi:hypothetical protein